jgi:GNAT superfamily N-acetyltransferase
MIHSPGTESLGTEAATFSPLDSERFGVRAARAHVVSETLPQVLDFCAAGKIDLLIARCATSDLAAAQNMEAHSFLLMDTLVYYRFDLDKKAIPKDAGEFLVRRLQPDDKDRIRALASAAFRGYTGHYHADLRLDRHKCDETYASWAERSVTLKTAADEVLVAEHDGILAGFATLRLNSPEEGEGLLYGVAPAYQRRGVCPALMIQSLRWCRSQHAQRMVISTQVTNVSMQKVWCRVGFEPSHSYYTFHKWFDQ